MSSEPAAGNTCSSSNSSSFCSLKSTNQQEGEDDEEVERVVDLTHSSNENHIYNKLNSKQDKGDEEEEKEEEEEEEREEDDDDDDEAEAEDDDAFSVGQNPKEQYILRDFSDLDFKFKSSALQIEINTLQYWIDQDSNVRREICELMDQYGVQYSTDFYSLYVNILPSFKKLLALYNEKDSVRSMSETNNGYESGDGGGGGGGLDTNDDDDDTEEEEEEIKEDSHGPVSGGMSRRTSAGTAGDVSVTSSSCGGSTGTEGRHRSLKKEHRDRQQLRNIALLKYHLHSVLHVEDRVGAFFDTLDKSLMSTHEHALAGPVRVDNGFRSLSPTATAAGAATVASVHKAALHEFEEDEEGLYFAKHTQQQSDERDLSHADIVRTLKKKIHIVNTRSQPVVSKFTYKGIMNALMEVCNEREADILNGDADAIQASSNRLIDSLKKQMQEAQELVYMNEYSTHAKLRLKQKFTGDGQEIFMSPSMLEELETPSIAVDDSNAHTDGTRTGAGTGSATGSAAASVRRTHDQISHTSLNKGSSARTDNQKSAVLRSPRTKKLIQAGRSRSSIHASTTTSGRSGGDEGQENDSYDGGLAAESYCSILQPFHSPRQSIKPTITTNNNDNNNSNNSASVSHGVSVMSKSAPPSSVNSRRFSTHVASARCPSPPRMSVTTGGNSSDKSAAAQVRDAVYASVHLYTQRTHRPAVRVRPTAVGLHQQRQQQHLEAAVNNTSDNMFNYTLQYTSNNQQQQQNQPNVTSPHSLDESSESMYSSSADTASIVQYFRDKTTDKNLSEHKKRNFHQQAPSSPPPQQYEYSSEMIANSSTYRNIVMQRKPSYMTQRGRVFSFYGEGGRGGDGVGGGSGASSLLPQVTMLDNNGPAQEEVFVADVTRRMSVRRQYPAKDRLLHATSGRGRGNSTPSRLNSPGFTSSEQQSILMEHDRVIFGGGERGGGGGGGKVEADHPAISGGGVYEGEGGELRDVPRSSLPSPYFYRHPNNQNKVHDKKKELGHIEENDEDSVADSYTFDDSLASSSILPSPTRVAPPNWRSPHNSKQNAFSSRNNMYLLPKQQQKQQQPQPQPQQLGIGNCSPAKSGGGPESTQYYGQYHSNEAVPPPHGINIITTDSSSSSSNNKNIDSNSHNMHHAVVIQEMQFIGVDMRVLEDLTNVKL